MKTKTQWKDVLTEEQLEELANEEFDRNADSLASIVTPVSMGPLRKAFIQQFRADYLQQGGKIKRKSRK